jgi:hypothetical protein
MEIKMQKWYQYSITQQINGWYWGIDLCDDDGQKRIADGKMYFELASDALIDAERYMLNHFAPIYA